MQTKFSFLATILAIESSCDETSAAICINGSILSNCISSQKIHEQFGGVVPELAGREHIKHIVPIVNDALEVAKIKLNQIDAIAFTAAPGLIGSLLVGSMFAKSLSLVLQKPLIAVHHMQAHVLANLIQSDANCEKYAVPDFPFLCLTVSGGHTQIVQCNSSSHMVILGETIDDAAGECFDKAAKMIGLPYPGGPLIDKYAKSGDGSKYIFPEPNVPGLNFSFSGVKTAFLYFLNNAGKSLLYKKEFLATTEERENFINANLNDICASIQSRIIQILLRKLEAASKSTQINNICLAGGVSANTGLRNSFINLGKKNNWKTFIPKMEYCTDNAAMIAIAGYYKYLQNQFSNLDVPVTARAVW